MQFTRIANFYFLILLGLQCIPVIASVHWIYTLFPLSFVLLCSAIKEGYDDLVGGQFKFILFAIFLGFSKGTKMTSK
jgi:hypothetical protein